MKQQDSRYSKSGGRLTPLVILAGALFLISFLRPSFDVPRNAGDRPAGGVRNMAGREKVVGSRIAPTTVRGQVKAGAAARERGPDSGHLQVRATPLGDRFSKYVELASNRSESGIRCRTIRLLEGRDGDRPIRVEEQWLLNGHGSWVLVSQQAMVADRLLVSADDRETRTEVAMVAAAAGYKVAPAGRHASFLKVELPTPDLSKFDQAQALMRSELDEHVIVEPDYLFFPDVLPNDTWINAQWAAQRMELPLAWAMETGTSEVVVAVLDSGIDFGHPDLTENIWVNPGEIADNGVDDDQNGFVDDVSGWDFHDEDNDPADEAGHGSHVSGIIAARGNNGLGVAGVAWNVSIIPLRVGNNTFATSGLVESLNYLLNIQEDQGLRVLATNNSYGSVSASFFLRNAIQRHRAAGILFVAAAGNDSRDSDQFPSYPAGYRFNNVITVAATTGGDNLASFSNFGVNSVHIGAPGGNIYSTLLHGSYGYREGTSMAAPQVTGAAALLLSADPGLSHGRIRSILFNTADRVASLDGVVSTGARLNPARALEAVTDSRRPSIEILSPSVSSLRISRPGVGLELSARLVDAIGNLSRNPSDFVWKVFPDRRGAVIESPGELATSIRFKVAGDFSVKAIYTLDEVQFSDEIYVRLGPGEILDDDLAGWWKFDQTDGEVAPDSSGNRLTGVPNDADWVPGRVGNALRFNGVDDRVAVPAPDLDQFTMSAWFRTDTRGNSVFPRIINHPEFLLYLGRRENGHEPDERTIKFFSGRSGSDGVWNTRINVIGDGRWYHLAATYDAEDVLAAPRIFLDGAELPVAVQNVPKGNRRLEGTIAYFGDDGEATRAYDGLIDDVRIFSRLLNPAEISALASPESLTSVSGVIAMGSQPAVAVGEWVEINGIRTSVGSSSQSVGTSWEVMTAAEAVELESYEDEMTKVRFSSPGLYSLRFVADEGVAKVFAELSITVTDDAASSPVARNVARELIEGSGELGSGWKLSSWFGSFNVLHAPWIFHDDHKWLFLAADSELGIWLFDREFAWIWTSESVYPSVFRSVDETWLWYDRSSGSPRTFFNFSRETWEEVQ